MSNEQKPLSERVRRGEFDYDYCGSVSMKITDSLKVSNEIAVLESRLAAAEAEKQAAIDAALESLKTSCRKCEYDEADGSLIDHCPDCQRKIVTALYAIKGTNPLAETQSRIAELEEKSAALEGNRNFWKSNCAELDARIAELEEQCRGLAKAAMDNGQGLLLLERENEELAHQLAESECHNVYLASWQCPYTDGKSGLTSDERGNQYCAKDRELAEARKDAERYRWLKSSSPKTILEEVFNIRAFRSTFRLEPDTELDHAIDAAMKERDA